MAIERFARTANLSTVPSQSSSFLGSISKSCFLVSLNCIVPVVACMVSFRLGEACEKVGLLFRVGFVCRNDRCNAGVRFGCAGGGFEVA